MRHVLDIEVIQGRYYLKLDNFNPIEVPPQFKTAMEDLIDEVLEEGKKLERENS
jgi:hypothetical protein